MCIVTKVSIAKTNDLLGASVKFKNFLNYYTHNSHAPDNMNVTY